ncbi:uncharacterized protein LOC142176148 [Nicotiana tabacum]|uniref:Uncharacterized protein LOC142176148 n=1 Tax=Nicotiana tabacum TaxID=4097 RepID=A0AC58TQ37_TOBAC
MHDFIMAEDSELWDVICDGPYIPTKALAKLPLSMPKTRKEYTDADRKVVEKNFRAKKILVCGIAPDEYNRISACEDAKEILEALQTTHEGTTQVKQSKIYMLTIEWSEEMEGMLKRGSSSKPKNYDLCHKCGKPGHFIKDCPLLKQEYSKYNLEKAAKRNLVHDKDFKRRRFADNVVKQALTAWGDSSSESEDEIDAGDSSMMAVQSEENEYNSIFALMAQSDDDEDDNNSEDALTLELGEVEQTRDDLVVCVVDLKETICELEKEKSILTKKIANIEHERDDLVVVVVDHKETIENFRKEREALMKRLTEIEEERDDLLVVIADLRETIEGLGTESKLGYSGKGKEIASEEHIRLGNKLKAVRTKAITSMYANNGGNRLGIGFQREKTPYNPHNKYFTVPDNWLCTHYGNNGHFKENCQARVQSLQKNKVFAKNGTVKESSQQCLLSVSQICDKENTVEFLSKICTVTNLVTSEVKTRARKLLSSKQINSEGPGPWSAHSKFKVEKVCDACAREKHVKYSFKYKKDVSTSKPLDLLHMDLCGRMRVQSRGGKRYIFLIVDDYSRFTWNLFLRTKDETFEVFVAFVKKIQTKCVEKSVHVIFDVSYPSCEKSSKDDQDGEPLLVPDEVINMTNGKADMMSQEKEPSGDNAASSSMEPSTSITTNEAEERVVDVVHDTPLVPERRTQENQLNIPTSSTNEPQMSNWKHKSSHPLDNIITPLDSRVQSRSKARNSLAFSAFLSQIESKMKKSTKGTFICQQKYIKELLKRFDMEASKVIDTPITRATRLDMDETGSPLNQTMYRGIIGSLLYLTTTVFSVGLCYLVDMKNTYGMAPFLGSCLISWGTMKQNSVALSTIEVEYIVAASCCAQLLWIK